ncbi:putative peptide/nitrate transporter [Heracleum sosnowskyi]|uniref:Peptide/nitrate transporter n=1 Tax=Heracleum sosnowskyi TaxID=360622 RepID=A0AAD8MLV6_9APIA|nr:putative peptide/nitrate transporter [Heracleum sosnowskyi]
MKTSSEQVTRKLGGLRTMPFIIANEAFEKVASTGLHANMILYLVFEYHMDVVRATTVLFLWNAIANFMPILGAFLSDSYLGRFRVIALGTVITLIGTVILWLTAIFPEFTPPYCDIRKPSDCVKANSGQLAILFISLAVMAIGAGGIRPCSLAFGADQFDKPNNPENERTLQRFFNLYYASVGISLMISVTVIVYIQNVFGWIVGFGVPVGCLLLSTVLFLIGSPLFIKIKPNKSMLQDFVQVVSLSWKNKHLALPPEKLDGWYHHNQGSKFVAPTDKLRFLNKACVLRIEEPDGSAVAPKNKCTVEQVEEFKALIRVLPIWSTGIIIAVTVSQHSFPVLQADTMDRTLIGDFKIPSGSYGVFTLLTLTIWVALYDQLIVPLLTKITKIPGGITLQQRMGTGLFLSILATAVAAITEKIRRQHAIDEGLLDTPKGVVNMSAMWLIPQYAIIGLAEAFNAIGQIEFYYSQFPKSMGSIGVALFALGSAFGNLLGSLIVEIVDKVSKHGGKESWVGNNLNKGHYDYYYWVLAILCAANFFYFLVCTWAYGPNVEQKVWNHDAEESMDMEKDSELYESSMISVALSKQSPLHVY